VVVGDGVGAGHDTRRPERGQLEESPAVDALAIL
jgi:hypothetical protein